MSTSNFSRSNWTKHYAVFYEEEDYFTWHDLKNELQEAIEAAGGYALDRWEARPDRQVLGAIDIPAYDPEYKFWEDVSVELVLEPGYFSGAMINYQISHDLEDMNKTTRAKIQRAIDKLEKIAKLYATDQLIRVATFSNGETIYDRA